MRLKAFAVALLANVLLANGSITLASTLVEVDLYTPGDALLTLDTSTGLEWLDITLTAGLSYNDVIEGVGNNWVTEQGFRYARAAEVDHFFRQAGWDGIIGWRIGSFDAADNILNLWGAYGPLGTYHYLNAMTSDGTDNGKWFATVSLEHPDYNQGNVMPWTPHYPYSTGAPVLRSADERYAYLSQALVRLDGWVTCADDMFEPPFNDVISLKKQTKKAIPVKMKLIDSDGYLVSDVSISAPPAVNVNYSPAIDVDNGTNPKLTPPGLADEGNVFRYDDPYWVIKLATKQFTSSGTYKVTAVAGDDSYVIDAVSCSGKFVRLQ